MLKLAAQSFRNSSGNFAKFGRDPPRLVVRQSWLNGDVLKESTTPILSVTV
jgi:hypothetical protein